MAGRAQHGTPGRGRSSRTGSSVRRAAAGSGAASGYTTFQATATEPTLPPPLPTTIATYRNLLARGLSADEAATLTAFVWGIPAGTRWNLREINRLLFIRQVRRAGGFGPRDGIPN
jgi:hypothetical protein